MFKRPHPPEWDPVFDYENRHKWLRTIAKAFKEYKAEGKTMEDFEEDYGCSVTYEEHSGGIADVTFQNDSCKTAFMLKYNL